MDHATAVFRTIAPADTFLDDSVVPYCLGDHKATIMCQYHGPASKALNVHEVQEVDGSTQIRLD